MIENPKVTDQFRLRKFVDLLAEEGELDTHDEALDLIDISQYLDSNRKAALFRKPGGNIELVGNVMGGRRRLALAFGVSEADLLKEVMARLKKPIPPREVSSEQAPVHEIVLTGDDADFTRLPVHLQHAKDGAPYISASIDITESADKKRRNVGYRRMMLRGRKEAGIDLIAPSDLRALFATYVQEKKKMPIAFVVGSHPTDCFAAVCMSPVDDEVALMGAMRGSPVPLVRCKTIDAMVPADAEVVLEGYLDERGWIDDEGPFGEFLGYNGMVKTNPVFHLTAITMRRDALFQTATIGGRLLGRTDTAQLCALRTEATAWAALENAVRDPVAIYCSPSCGGMFNIRVSLRQRYPGEAMNAISAILGSTADVKHVFVVDDDIDIYSDEQMEWAFATRFQANRDLVVNSGYRAMPLDPSLNGARTGGKAGFDLTLPFGRRHENEFCVPEVPQMGPLRDESVRAALESGPKSFLELMEASGSRDGRDVLIALDEVRTSIGLGRAPDGRYALKRA
ncbi:MAG: UbiD family decarboxylase [Noviherbaspirillum sp.]|nr:UbiD family decarboxylase [Noviherbaspirillum sp.]